MHQVPAAGSLLPLRRRQTRDPGMAPSLEKAYTILRATHHIPWFEQQWPGDQARSTGRGRPPHLPLEVTDVQAQK